MPEPLYDFHRRILKSDNGRSIYLPVRAFLLDSVLCGFFLISADFLLYIPVNAGQDLRIRLCRIIALDQIHTKADHRLKLLRGLNALSQNLKMVLMRKDHDILDKMLFLWIVLNTRQKHTVYFHIIGHIAQ